MGCRLSRGTSQEQIGQGEESDQQATTSKAVDQHRRHPPPSKRSSRVPAFLQKKTSHTAHRHPHKESPSPNKGTADDDTATPRQQELPLLDTSGQQHQHQEPAYQEQTTTADTNDSIGGDISNQNGLDAAPRTTAPRKDTPAELGGFTHEPPHAVHTNNVVADATGSIAAQHGLPPLSIHGVSVEQLHRNFQERLLVSGVTGGKPLTECENRSQEDFFRMMDERVAHGDSIGDFDNDVTHDR